MITVLINWLLFLTGIKDLQKRVVNSVLNFSQGRSDEGKHLGCVSGSFGIWVTNHSDSSNSHSRRPITEHHIEVGRPPRTLSAAFLLLSAVTLSRSASSFFWSKACAFVYTGGGTGFHIDHVLGVEQPRKPFKRVALYATQPAEAKPLIYTPPIMAHMLEVKYFSSKILNPNQTKMTWIRMPYMPYKFPNCSAVQHKGDSTTCSLNGEQVTAWIQPLAFIKNCPNQNSVFQVKLNI